MPFNGSGTFTALTPPNYPAVSGSVISSTAYNNFTADMMNNGLSLCLVRDGQAAMTGSLNAGGFRITNLLTPSLATDTATKAYADLMLPLAGGTLSGVLVMGANKITGLGAPTVGTDATTKTYVDATIASSIAAATFLPLAGGAMTGAIAMGSNKITGLGTPTLVGDAATKAYADLMLPLTGGALTGAVTTSANFTINGANLSITTGTASISNANTAITSPQLTLLSTNAAGVAGLQFTVNGTLRGRVRSDAAGNTFYVTNGADHQWYTGGDVGTGALQASLTNSGFFYIYNRLEIVGSTGPGTINAPGAITSTASTINDVSGNLRDIPQNSQTTGYTLVASDRGKSIVTTAGVTIPASVLAAGNAVTIYNNSAASITITQGVGCTLRLVGTATTGNRTLALRGLATVFMVSATEAVITGGGLT